MPNQAFTSFTRTWIGFFSGNISVDDLKTGTFKFACTREHLFPHDNTIDTLGPTYPAEITWVAGVVTPTQSLSQYRRHTGRVPISYVSDEVKEKFNEFLCIISDRDYDGDVEFRDDDETEGMSSDAVERFITRRWKAIVEHVRKWEG